MKSYTDLEQSKKLAEILPLESADMYYEWPNKKVHFKDDEYSGMGLSCWSLSALLGVLPKEIVHNKNIVFLELHVWENSLEYAVWWDRFGLGCVSYLEKEGNMTLSGTTYVHQLQQVLRLFDLDKFIKIEL